MNKKDVLVFNQGLFVVGDKIGPNCALGAVSRSLHNKKLINDLMTPWSSLYGVNKGIHMAAARRIGKLIHFGPKKIKMLARISSLNERGKWVQVTNLLRKLKLYNRAKKYAMEVI